MAGAGRMLIVSGEAGAGKSRLVAELVGEATRRDMLVVIGRSHATERVLPFSPWVEALRGSVVVEANVRGTTLRKSTMAELAQLVPEFGEPTPAARADAEGWRRLFDAVADFLGAVSHDRPLLVLLEDVHWADDMSIRLLAFVARRVARWPALVIATVRDEELEDAQVLRGMLGELANESHIAHLQLGPLLEADIRTLTELLSPRVAASDRRRIVEQAWRTSQGNPLVAVETVRALRARPADSAETRLPLPERVRDLVRERFGRLGTSARDLLSVAAVVGRDFEFALLRRAAGMDDDEAAAGVEELVRRRVLHEVGERFDFTHDRIREVAAADILAPRRRLLHRRIGEALEALNQANLEPHLAALALHFREAEVWGKAVTYLLRAGIGAWQRSAFLEGRALLDEAVRVLEYLPATRESVEQAVDIRLSLHRCLYPVGAFALAHDHLRAAEAAAAALDDARRKARVAVYLSEMHRSMGDHDVAARYAADGLGLATEAGDAMLEVEATFQFGVICMFRGEPREAIVHFEAGIRRGEDWPLARRAGYPYLLCVCRLARVLASLGEFATARVWGERALEIAEATGHPFSVACACFDIGHVGVEQGDVSFAIPYLERSLRIADDHHLKVFHPLLAACGGHALALAGRREEAAALLDLLLEEPPTQIRNAPVSFAFAQAAAGLRHLGNLEAARVIANRAVELARTRRERLYEANALVQLAAVAASETPPRWDDAGRCYSEALVIAEAAGARPRIADCLLGLGRVHAARRDPNRARDHFARTASLFHDMVMPSGVTTAERELRDLA
jgi:tetratricopeptide (TPR) repeat protein